MTKRLLLGLWSLACVAVLLITVTKYDGAAESDIGIFLVWAMLVLTFPIGLLVAALFTALVIAQEELGIQTIDLIQSSYVGFAVLWLVFVFAGYWQWFHFVPKLWSLWRARPGSEQQM
jgi:hypothetical protein